MEFLEDDDGNIGVDFIGKLENLEEDYNHLREQVPTLPLFDGRYHLNKTTNDKANWPLSSLYNKQQQELVYEMFEQDFIKLGYRYDEL